ncbi:head decoration protein [Mesorhizobium sp. M8A.F.Ca.ET.057.01.1.1]|uniref:head decoration protein n=1 Tax=Mesorhizobium sp. M8A.F.Ca.ET.057.01.1.1 TaxID=2493679 RepID=UPI000F75C041|nr:head decoration protein [Mesorhizobium sp. M8A.F.Ca.ET.057.01.1.1]AZO54900.1 head decoration protein [Mesorhizobium sp. M8A.F.Ca.ET.057.01.1.1]
MWTENVALVAHEGRHAAEFILSEGNGHISRDLGKAGATLAPGAVVKLSGNKLVSYDGTGTVAGIMMYDCVDDAIVTFIVRKAEVNGKLLTSTEQTSGEIDAGAIAGLLALGIAVR